MFNRRHFLKNAAFGAAAVALNGCQNDSKTTSAGSKTPEKAGSPLIIATWNRLEATAEGWKILQKNGRALDAVEAGARLQEADENDQSVGLGGLPDRDGHVTLDACIMDEKGNAGSVSFVQNHCHVASIARRVMEKTPHVMLVGKGAEQFAEAEGFEKINLLTEKSRLDWEAWKLKSEYKPVINIERHDTIGLLALDRSGNLGGACTTSGLAYKMHGRVGDSPIIGAGLFVDNEVGGAVATGLGELMLKTLGSFLVVEFMRNGLSPTAACRKAVERIGQKCETKDAQVGFVAINRAGEFGGFGLRKGFNYSISRAGESRIFEAEFLLAD